MRPGGGPCSSTFEQLAHQLGGFGCHGQSLVAVHDPFGLTNGTLPVIELLLIAGAVAALAHAIRRWRREGDPTNLALWIACVIALFVIEPPLYFPEQYHVPRSVGLVFAHNQFSVELLWGRLPLYIVALYPALTCLAYELVRSLGVFERRGALVGAAAVGITHSCFYEIFDQLGPQLRWWIWNPASSNLKPSLDAVPLSSLVLFATVAPTGMALLIRLVVARAGQPSGFGVAWRIVVCGVLAPVWQLLGSVPGTIASGNDTSRTTVIGACLVVELVLIAAVGLSGIVGTVRAGSGGSLRRYPVAYGWTFLAVLAGLWVSALPDLLDAHGGITADHTPIGSLPYALGCFVVASGVLVVSGRPSGRAAPRPAAAALHAPSVRTP